MPFVALAALRPGPADPSDAHGFAWALAGSGYGSFVVESGPDRLVVTSPDGTEPRLRLDRVTGRIWSIALADRDDGWEITSLLWPTRDQGPLAAVVAWALALDGPRPWLGERPPGWQPWDGRGALDAHLPCDTCVATRRPRLVGGEGGVALLRELQTRVRRGHLLEVVGSSPLVDLDGPGAPGAEWRLQCPGCGRCFQLRVASGAPFEVSLRPAGRAARPRVRRPPLLSPASDRARRGEPIDVDRRTELAREVLGALHAARGTRPTLTALAAACRVAPNTLTGRLGGGRAVIVDAALGVGRSDLADALARLAPPGGTDPDGLVAWLQALLDALDPHGPTLLAAHAEGAVDPAPPAAAAVWEAVHDAARTALGPQVDAPRFVAPVVVVALARAMGRPLVEGAALDALLQAHVEAWRRAGGPSAG